MTPKNEVEHGVCSYCGADRSGPSAEAHEPNCLYAEPEPQGSDNSAGPGVPPSAELKDRAQRRVQKLMGRSSTISFDKPSLADELELFASSILEGERHQKTFKGFVAIGCGKHVRNSMGSLAYDLDCLDCQRQPMMAWWKGSPPIDLEQQLAEARDQAEELRANYQQACEDRSEVDRLSEIQRTRIQQLEGQLEDNAMRGPLDGCGA